MTSQLEQSVNLTSQNRQGLGLRLFIAKAIVTGHRGSFEAESPALDVTIRVTLSTGYADTDACILGGRFQDHVLWQQPTAYGLE